MFSPVIDLLVRAAMLLIAAWLTAAAARRRSASLGALIWTSALGGLLLLPVFSRVLPSWPVEVWRVERLDTGARSELTTVASPRLPARETEFERTETIATPKSVEHTTSSFTPPAPTPAVVATWMSWSAAGLWLWVLVTCTLLARLASGYARLANVLRRSDHAVDLDPAWPVLVANVRLRLGIRRPVAVLATGDVSVPSVAGVWKPVLVLPLDADDWTPEVRRAVVFHELAHVARWDALAQLLSQIACRLYWFLPLAWIGARRAASLRERACDDAVLRAGVRPATYADSLIQLASDVGASWRAGALAMASPSRLHERIVSILDPVARRDAVGRWAAAVVIVAGGAGLTALTAVEPIASVLPETVAAPAGVDIALSAAPMSTAPLSAAPAIATAPMSDELDRRAARAEVTAGTAAIPQDSNRLCGRGLDNSSSSIHEDNGRRRWTVKLSGAGCQVDLRAEGKIEFNADFTDISAIPGDGFFRLDVTDQGVRRQLDIDSKNGTLSRTWRIDGRERPYDADARAWFASFLIELDRRTGIGVDIRLPLLLRQGGVDAVLKETALMASDYARGLYYTRLARTTKLTPADVTRVLNQAALLTKSDYYSTELLRAIAGQGLTDSSVRVAVAGLIGRMESDYYQAESVDVLAGAGKIGAAEMTLLLQTVQAMESDHYKVQALTKILNSGNLDGTQQESLARAASGIKSDYYAGEFLKAIAGARPMSPAVRRAYLEGVAGIESDQYAADALTTLIRRETPGPAEVDGILQRIGALDSDHYRGEVISRLLSVQPLTERDLLNVVETVRKIRSDYNKAAALRLVAEHRAATPRVADAVLSASEGMSRHYADEVRRAVRKG